MRDNNYINSYLQNMLTSNVPEATKSMILNLNDYGKRAIVNYHDPSSDFHKHADLKDNIFKFSDSAEDNTPLFHYTTVSSLNNILKSGYFRIKQAKSMNDPNEFRWASSLAISYLEKQKATYEEIDNFQKMVDNQPFHDSYIWSFSKNEDSETLFYVYGRQEGLALELGEKDVMDMLVSHNSHGKDSFDKFGLGDAYTFPLKVLYNAQEQEEYVAPLVQEWLDAYRGLKNDPDDIREILTCCSKNIALFNMAFKNSKLFHEEEFRFVSSKKNDGSISPELKIGNVNYINCEFIPECIRSVTISPTCSVEEQDITEMVRKYVPHAYIKKSDLPY